MVASNELQKSQGVPRAPTSALNIAMGVAEPNLNGWETKAEVAEKLPWDPDLACP